MFRVGAFGPPCEPRGVDYLSSKMNSSSTVTAPDAGTSLDEPIETSLKLWVVLSRAYGSVVRKVEAHIAEQGLTPMEFGILEVLHHRGPLLLGEIQRKVLVTSGGTTYLVDRLTEKGLVKREECPTDRRARYAVLTPAGTELIERIFPEHARMVKRALSGLSQGEQEIATDLLRKLGLAAQALAEKT
jgi:MarR family transcriptional regulator, 2-MHQ and catechol-resistance regulon repressor